VDIIKCIGDFLGVQINNNIKDCVSKWLKKNGCDGLYDEYCGCFLKDLMSCENSEILYNGGILSTFLLCYPAKYHKCVDCYNEPEECDNSGIVSDEGCLKPVRVGIKSI